MDSSTIPQLGQRDRLNSISSARSALGRSNSLAPNNDYAFQDRGLAPEREPTKERATSRDTSLNVTPVSGLSEDEDHALDDVRPNVYQTYAGRRRAKVPDKEEESSDASTGDTGSQVNGLPSNQQPNRDAGGQRPSHQQRPRPVAQTLPPTKLGEERRLRHVMLHWEKAKIRGLEKIVLNVEIPKVRIKSQIASQNYVSWQHSKVESMTLKGLEDLIIEAKAQGIQESEVALTRRLLKRVRLDSERPFVGGRFLTPRALRYDSVDSSKYSADKCCVFLAFPYFAVARDQPRKATEKNAPEHSVRTLLQSVYRLNNTSERDQTQCIRMLRRKNLRSCIEADETEVFEVSRRVKEELIYVPQLWALTIGLDRLITYGSISDKSLRGRSLEVRQSTRPGDQKRCSLVRIYFRNQRRIENLTYPIQQCACWFGLVNKQQQIRGVLRKGKEISDPKQYKLHVHGQVFDASIWASIQKMTQSDVLELWMETPKPMGLKVSVDSPKTPNSTQVGQERKFSVAQDVSPNEQNTVPSSAAVAEEDVQDHEEAGLQAGLVEAPPAEYDRIEDVPIVKPFLHWRIIDESGDRDECPMNERVDRFLNLVYRNLPAAVGDTTSGFIESPGSTSNVALTSLAKGMKKASIRGKSQEDVSSELLRSMINYSEEHRRVARAVLNLMPKILVSFLPREHESQAIFRNLFWGAVHEILSRGSLSYLKDVYDRVDVLHAWVQRIHLGVHFRRTESTPGGQQEKDDISDCAILLSSLINAFGAINSFLVESVRDLVLDSEQPKCGKKASKTFKEAQRALETARDELIVEASGIATGEQIGPILTPEAILILQMDRLVHGVFSSGNVDIISILEECLERLALKVRYRYSRRLLQMINGFEEEVAAVHDVLLQQQRILGEFRGYLQPTSYDTPSTARKMRFDYEQKGIERILVTLRDQLKNCTELQERAKVLAVQNVHLVETLQDDNGRAIFIFTFITILFLPLTFVAGFFGMNLKGVGDTTSHVPLFWKIGAPVTAAIVSICFAVIIWGERMWFGLASIPRYCAKMYRK